MNVIGRVGGGTLLASSATLVTAAIRRRSDEVGGFQRKFDPALNRNSGCRPHRIYRILNKNKLLSRQGRALKMRDWKIREQETYGTPRVA